MPEEASEFAQYSLKVYSTTQNFIGKEAGMEDIIDKLSKITHPITAIVIIAVVGMTCVVQQQESPKGN